MDSKKLIKKYNIINFNWKKYIDEYKLEEKGINDVRNAYKYYINTGFKSGHKWYGFNKRKKKIIKPVYKKFCRKKMKSIKIDNIDNTKIDKEKDKNISISRTYKPKKYNIINFNWKKYIKNYKLEKKGIKNIRDAYKYFLDTGFKSGHKWYGINRRNREIIESTYEKFYRKNMNNIINDFAPPFRIVLRNNNKI